MILPMTTCPRTLSSSFTSSSSSAATRPRGGCAPLASLAYKTKRRRAVTTTTISTTTTRASVVSEATDVSSIQPLPADFEAIKYTPSPLEPGALNAQFAVLGVVSITVAYWWFVVVPAARINLAVNKNQGKLKTYLEELKRDESRTLERWFFTEWLMKIDPETKYLLRDDGEEEETIGLGDTEGGGDKTKSEDIDIIIQRARKTPDFFSLDNPVLVAFIITFGFSAVIGLLGEVSAGVLEN
jgi:hypothetical protein